MFDHFPKDYDYLSKSASMTDCTGLIPEGPVDETALETYQEIYPFGGKEMADTIREDVYGEDNPSSRPVN
ncbi:MAG: hypothetical protein ACI39H_03890 [Lachnospiraceae bacterium]